MLQVRDAVKVEGFCAVCQKRVAVEVSQDYRTTNLQVGAVCHGEREIQQIPFYQKDLMISFFRATAQKRKAAAARKYHAWRGRGRLSARRNGWRL